ncbi:hypothetical protein SAMN03159463_04951 [Mesorhizobium sp. NFR06]|uniref:hypothetical protein n=1 Tax=Mesorhizobium sp. NFR06 TaxID=1566290 RepID=UPI0008EF2A97|nr:hypothetical protein [Mesorhizobium sp. NFR06]SFP82316.1 hypothetical protein SAMN03159463_04951 [Mesorhizobium sp. NFR06]
MKARKKTFGTRRAPIAEFRSLEEEFTKGELSKRSERAFAIYLTPLFALAVVAILIFSPESRALALELGSKAIELGKDWVLRGLLE